eukprot:jgi/Ulvmu1/4839/UM020_0125.1
MCATDGPSLEHDIPVLLGITHQIKEDVQTARSHVAAFKAIFEQYQEQPQLMDAYLEHLLQPLLGVLIDSVNHLEDKHHFAAVMQVCRILQAMVHTCGHKTIALFLPNKPSDLTNAVALLTHVQALDATQEVDEDAQDGHWQAMYVVLLWLSVLVLVPFHLGAIEMPASVRAHADQASNEMFATWLIESVKPYLASPGPIRDISAILLSKLVTRAEMSIHRNDLLGWCWKVLKTDPDDAVQRSFVNAGVLAMLASMLQDGSRPVMISHVHGACTNVVRLLSSGVLTSDTTGRKLACKVLQRCALTLLDPLRENSIATATKARKQRGVLVHASDATEVLALTTSGRELLPEVIDQLLMCLRDQDTVVRWSAAKGLGRIAARLPSAFVEDVNDAILELLSHLESDCAWQGGCLALAEVARQGLLGTDRLPEVVPLICEALCFEQRRGAFSVGAHVRDAAAYVCWAFARAYRPDAVLASFQVLAPALLCTACYDREVACRRAAAAAFQECVGRFGAESFPEGMGIIADADYFTLGSRSQAYLKVAPSIAMLPQYLVPLFEHVMHNKLPSWDPAVRELAAEALAQLVSVDPQFAAEQVMTRILPSCLSKENIELPHGACLAMGATLPALSHVGYSISSEQQHKVVDVAQELGKSGGRSGPAGDMMRVATCRLIGVFGSLAYILDEQQVAALLQIIDDNLEQTNMKVQEAAGESLLHFLQTHAANIPHGHIKKYCSLLSNHVQCRRIGAALALTVIPDVLLRDEWPNVSHQLCTAIDAETAPEREDVDARVAAIKALVALLRTGWQGEVQPCGVPEEQACVKVGVPVLIRTLVDYTTDRRGDVGSLVREAGMHALLQLCCQMMEKCLLEDKTMAKLLADVTCACLRQACERIARVRGAAARTIMELLEYQARYQPGAKIHAAARVRAMLQHVTSKGHLGGVQSTPHVIALMTVSLFRPFILEGAIASIGGIDQNLSQATADALCAIIVAPDLISPSQGTQDMAGTPAKRLERTTLVAALIHCWQQNRRSNRLATAFLKTLNVLLSRHTVTSRSLADDDANTLIALIRNEGRQCSDSQRLCCIAEALCYLTVVGRGNIKQALQAVMVLLGSKMPTVRNHAADRLYVAALMLERRAVSDPAKKGWSRDILKEVQTLLCSINWGAVDGAPDLKAVRDKIVGALGIDPPAKREPRTVKATQPKHEETSYKNLINDFARGM